MSKSAITGWIIAAFVCAVLPGRVMAQETIPVPIKEYSELLEKAKRLDAAISPSEAKITCELTTRDRAITPLITIDFRFKTIQRNQRVILGLKGAVPTSANFRESQVKPSLQLANERIVVNVDQPGEYELTLAIEISTTLLNQGRDAGIMLDLPEAVLTSLSLVNRVPLERLTMTSKSSAANEPVKKTLLDSAMKGPHALGAVRELELAWPVDLLDRQLDSSLDVEIVSEISETEIRNRYDVIGKGSQKSFELRLPAGMTFETSADRKSVWTATKLSDDATKTISLWKLQADASTNEVEWKFSFVQKLPRTARGQFTLGPIQTSLAKSQLTGRIRVFSPNTIRHRMVNSEFTIIEEQTQEFKPSETIYTYRKAMDERIIATVETLPSLSQIQVKPTHRVSFVQNLCQLQTVMKLLPRNRTLRELKLAVPSGWSTVQVGPEDLVDEVSTKENPDGSRLLSIILDQSQSQPFELILDTTRVIDLKSGMGSVTIPLPQFQDIVERDTRLTASISDSYEITGFAKRGQETIEITAAPSEILPGTITRSIPKNVVSVNALRGIDSATIQWKPYRPTLLSVSQVEVLIQERQYAISQTIQLTAPNRVMKPLRLKTPANAMGLRIIPSATSFNATDFAVPWPNELRDLTLTVSYALPVGPLQPIEFATIEDATETTISVSAWGPPGMKLKPPASGWKLETPKVIPNRDSFPWLTMSSNRVAGEAAPSWLPIVEPNNVTHSEVTIDAAAVVLTDTTQSFRYWLSDWPITGFLVDLWSMGDYEIFLDQKKYDSVTIGKSFDSSTILISPPDSKSNRSGCLLEIRRPISQASSMGPRILRSTLQHHVTWLVSRRNRSIAVDVSNRLDSFHAVTWAGWWRGYDLKAIDFDKRIVMNGDDFNDLLQWYSGTTTQFEPQPRIVLLPRWLVTAIMTLLCFSAVIIVMRIPRSKWGMVFTGLAIGITAMLVIAPLLLMQLLISAQAGIVATAIWLVVRRILASYRQQLPGFADSKETAGSRLSKIFVGRSSS